MSCETTRTIRVEDRGLEYRGGQMQRRKAKEGNGDGRERRVAKSRRGRGEEGVEINK